MTITASVETAAGDRKITASFEPPDLCPLCHHGILPRYRTAVVCIGQRLEAVFQCPRGDCQALFIGIYTSPNHTFSNWQLSALAPHSVQTPEFPESVTELSPDFVEIMSQVAVADAKDLDQLVGMGMRKAIEFLIKDFTIRERPDQKANIEKGELAWVIRQYIKDGNINTVAKRAVWLGNDETHYMRRWVDKDITDLKRLVQLTVNSIESHDLTREYRTGMPDPKKN